MTSEAQIEFITFIVRNSSCTKLLGEPSSFTVNSLKMESCTYNRRRSWVLVGTLMLWVTSVVNGSGDSQTCSIQDELERDPNLKEMTYDVGDGPKSFWAYVEPDITTFYANEPPATAKVVPKFNGLAAKFINMSKDPVTLFWEGNGHASAMRSYTHQR